MITIFAIIGAIVVFFVIMDWVNKQPANRAGNSQTKPDSGSGKLLNQYKILTDHMRNHPDSKILTNTNYDASFIVSGMSGTTTMSLINYLTLIEVKWELNSNVYGYHELSWRFDATENQYNMIAKMNSDLASYNVKFGYNPKIHG